MITSDIIEKLYGIGRSSFDITCLSECLDLGKELQEWSDDLPHQLSTDVHDGSIFPPHVLNLQLAKECSMIALQYPL